MNLDYIRKNYKVPAELGGRVRYNNQEEGTIVGVHNALLVVRMDDDPFTASYHPKYNLQYLPFDLNKATTALRSVALYLTPRGQLPYGLFQDIVPGAFRHIVEQEMSASGAWTGYDEGFMLKDVPTGEENQPS